MKFYKKRESYTLVKQLENEDKMVTVERRWINKYNSRPLEYNQSNEM